MNSECVTNWWPLFPRRHNRTVEEFDIRVCAVEAPDLFVGEAAGDGHARIGVFAVRDFRMLGEIGEEFAVADGRFDFGFDKPVGELLGD